MSELRIACVGDVHCRGDRLELVVKWIRKAVVDGIVVTGDFAPGPFNQADGAFADPLAATLAMLAEASEQVIYVPGNHDLRNLPATGGNVDRRSVEWLGIRVFGVGGAGPKAFGFPYEWTDEALSELGIPSCDLLLTHTPPVGTLLDRTATGHHAGSRTIRIWAESLVGLLVCGHVHEAAGTDMLGKCLCYNAGSLGEPFGCAQVGLATLETRTKRWHVAHHIL